nr:hypothetical protein Iba_scaffold1674186CG0010 [Ipomoea batatas]
MIRGIITRFTHSLTIIGTTTRNRYAICWTNLKRRWALESSGSTTKADKGSAPPDKPALPGSQFRISISFLVHQLVMAPRRNSHGLLFVLLTQEKKGQPLAIPRS